MELQRERSAIIKMRNKTNNQIWAYIARAMGYSTEETEAERKKKFDIAAKIQKIIVMNAATEKKMVEQNKVLPLKDLPKGYEFVKPVVEMLVLATNGSLAALEERKDAIEKAMAEQAKTLPVADWWQSHKGMAIGGLAKIVGEAGDIMDYENPAKLWKRFGVAVLAGVAQGKLPAGTAKETWIEHGYCKRRRSELWQIGDVLIKLRTPKYRDIYDERKAYETDRLIKELKKEGKDETKLKAIIPHRRAQRYMEKALLKDLFNQWHGN